MKREEERLNYYRDFLYGKVGLTRSGKKRVRGVDIGNVERFRCRTRYFTDSGIIGTKEFVERVYRQFRDNFYSKHDKRPKLIRGLEGVFSLKRLSEAL